MTPVTAVAVLRPAAAGDLPALLRLLTSQHLPVDDVPPLLALFTVAEHDGRIVGAIAVEPIGAFGLLRSAVVAEDWQGRGLGRDLVTHVIAQARARHVPALYLLTETAPDWFPRFGFARLPRTEAPEPLRRHAQFTTACPESAILMTLFLGTAVGA